MNLITYYPLNTNKNEKQGCSISFLLFYYFSLHAMFCQTVIFYSIWTVSKLVVLVFCEKDFNDKIMSNKLDQGVVVVNVLIYDETIFICSRIFSANSIIIDNNHSLAKLRVVILN